MPRLPPSLSTSPFQDAQSYRAFQYYFEVSEPPVARFFTSSITPLFQQHSLARDADKISSMFWTFTFPRLVCSDPVIAKCLLVMVTAHEKVQSSNCPFALEPECLQKSSDAIALLRSEWNNMSIDCILLASMLLALAELSFGPSPSGLSHLYAGSKIIRQRRVSPEDYAHHSTSPEIEGIRESIELFYEGFFAKMDGQRAILMPDNKTLDKELSVSGIWLPLKFFSTQQALGSLDHIRSVAQALIRADAAEIEHADRVNLRRQVRNWIVAFQNLETDLNSSTDPEFQKACLVIRMNGLATLIMSSLPTLELHYNQHKAEFEQIADFAEEFLRIGGGMTESVKAHHVFGVGPVNPLFFAATKCRFPLIRRRLLRAMKGFKVVQGLWTSCAAYQIASQIERIENSSGEGEPDTVTMAPVHHLTLDSVTFNGPEEITLTYHQQPYTDGKSLCIKTLPIQPCRHQGFLIQVRPTISCFCPYLTCLQGKVIISEFGDVWGFVKAADCECDELYVDIG
jgi:hypothetical protein